jgi:hypothetical protein
MCGFPLLDRSRSIWGGYTLKILNLELKIKNSFLNSVCVIFNFFFQSKSNINLVLEDAKTLYRCIIVHFVRPRAHFLSSKINILQQQKYLN